MQRKTWRLTTAHTIDLMTAFTTACIVVALAFLVDSCGAYRSPLTLTPEMFKGHQEAIRSLGLSVEETQAALKSLCEKYGDRVDGEKIEGGEC